MSRKSERKRVRKEMVATYIRSNPREGYDEIAKRVNGEIAKLGDTGTFADLKGIDKKLGLPRGTSFEMSGYADYFAFEED
jgi:hypothetical protein